MQYLLDTNTFIQAKNSYYAFDIAPSLMFLWFIARLHKE